VGLLIDDEAWPRITRHIQATKGKTLASIAYLGVDSPDLLPLRRDDVLVCDASPASIAAGSTSPVALRLFMHRGVEVFSAPGLHAKVIVTARRLFIGSANASAHSRDHLIEAVLETTDQSAVRESKDFILGLATDLNEVTAPQLDELDRIPVRRRGPATAKHRPPASVPGQVDRLWLFPYHRGAWSAKSQAAFDGSQRTVRRQAQVLGSRVRLDAIETDRNMSRRVRPGDWMIQVDSGTGRATPPGQVIQVTPIARAQVLLWIARPAEGARTASASALKAALAGGTYPPEAPHLLRSGRARRVLGVFRPEAEG
jgi:hypothetical protein